MSGYCGYDITLVDALRMAIGRALDELDGLRCSDVEAAIAMRAVSEARSMLSDHWLPFTTSLLSCRALDGYQPAAIGDGDLINSWLRGLSADRGWRIATDPLGNALSTEAALTADQVRAIGAALSGEAGTEPLAPDEIAWLASALEQIIRRQDLVAAFLPSLTTVGWSNLCNQIGRSRQQLVTDAVMFGGDVSADEQLGWSGIDRIFAGLGAILVADRAVHTRSDATLLLDDMTPYAAALLTAQLHLDADTLAATSRAIVEREQQLLDYPVDTVLGPRAGDLLFETMLATAGAPTAYVMLTVDALQLAMEATDDPDLAHRLVRTGTDPAAMTTAQAEIAMPALVRWTLGARSYPHSLMYDPDLAVTLADLAAPHLLQLLGSTPSGYGLTAKERSAMASFIIGDASAFDRLLAERARIVGGLSDPMSGDAAEQITALDDIAELLAIIDTMQRVRAVHTAEHDQAEWDLIWDVLDTAAGLVPLPGAWSMVPGASLTALHTVLDAAGVGPTSVGTVRLAALRSFETMTTIAAATVVCATFDRMTASGQVAEETPPPPMPTLDAADVGRAYCEAFEDWLATSGVDKATAQELNGVKQTFLSNHEATSDSTEALFGG